MKFEPIVAYLESQMPQLVSGVSLFVNSMPPTAEGILLKDSFGGIEIDGEIPSLRSGKFQLAARGRDYLTTKALVDQVCDKLTLSGALLPGMEVKTMRPLHEPIGFPTSDGNYSEFSVNFYTRYGIVAE